MGWYTSSDNCVNRVRLAPDMTSRIVVGPSGIAETIAKALLEDADRLQRSVFLALDGFKGVLFEPLVDALKEALARGGARVSTLNINTVFHSQSEIAELIRPYEKPEDPSFGRVFKGELELLLDQDKLDAVRQRWNGLRSNKTSRQIVICYGTGAATMAWGECFDRIAYLDVTREQILLRSEKNQVPCIGEDEPRGFPWKRIYYVEYPVLNKQKKRLLQCMDWYIDSSNNARPVLVPADAYHEIIAQISSQPICFKVFYMPGTFGGSEFSQRFKVSGLPNTSWDYEISVGDNHLIVDVDGGSVLEMPFYNVLFEQPYRVVGEFCHRVYPDHFPIAIYMQDGYFGNEPGADFKRTHMPHHLHPDTAYCKEHFGEPLGRYETYYIVRADPGACTMHGFKDDADIDEYIDQIKHSAATKTEFEWRKYIYEHPSKTGELHQLPPGTVHGTGGRQIILEIDTNPSAESTEYSFYLYDYCRPNFNYSTHDFTGSPAKLQIEHSLNIMRRDRRQKFMAEKCRPAPVCIREGSDWREMSFPMYYNMPYQINRFEFSARIEDDTKGMFHCLALTSGKKVHVYRKVDPSNGFVLEDCDNIVLPACFGPYVCENAGGGPCQVIKTFLLTERRDHIDQAREEQDGAHRLNGDEERY